MNKLSVIIPCYNEGENAPLLVARLIPALEGLGESFEVICVNDGSKDDTLERLLEIQKTEGYDPAFGHLRLSRLWANVAPKGSGGQHTKHRHPMSLLSGIIYLTEGEPTKFLDPCSARTGAAIEIPNNALFNDLLITPNPGMMIVFPSYVDHLTMPHYGTEDHRMTLAWNSLPERMVP
jgi:cellulose synthase/poly-beta-1,6-N-acetylglucosamine synthase-like glycosyltransferase